MIVMTAVRSNHRAFNMALYGALCVLTIATSTLDGAATNDPATPVDQADMLAPLSGKSTMAPIPDPVARAVSGDNVADSTSLGATPQGEKKCLATAIYFEARGENAKGQQAVAEVIVTRTGTRGRPRTICGVVYEGSQRKAGCQFSFTCDRASDLVRDRAAWSRAQRVATAVMRTRGKVKPVARGATFYHANHVTPYWASSMVKVAKIGSHTFYRP